mgnify:CR=1 FL=1
MLANDIAKGIEASGGSVSVKSCDDATSRDVLEAENGLIIGSPVFFGNPSYSTLQFVENVLGPFWENRTLAGRCGGVFSTGGGIHQGTESVMISLTRSLLAFGYRMVTPDVTQSGYDAAFGVSAVTGTLPYFPGTNGTIDAHFRSAAERFGITFANTCVS